MFNVALFLCKNQVAQSACTDCGERSIVFLMILDCVVFLCHHWQQACCFFSLKNGNKLMNRSQSEGATTIRQQHHLTAPKQRRQPNTGSQWTRLVENNRESGGPCRWSPPSQTDREPETKGKQIIDIYFVDDWYLYLTRMVEENSIPMRFCILQGNGNSWTSSHTLKVLWMVNLLQEEVVNCSLLHAQKRHLFEISKLYSEC